jgi:hypothetical protein
METINDITIEIPKKDMKKYHKEYYLKYYPLKKQEILERMNKNENCQFCSRSVAHQNITKHFKSKYCITRRNIISSLKQENKTN